MKDVFKWVLYSIALLLALVGFILLIRLIYESNLIGWIKYIFTM